MEISNAKLDIFELINVIKSAFKGIAEIDNINIPDQIDERTPIYGNNGCLDSLALVHLNVEIEEKLSKMGYNVIIASEKAFSRRISPFLTVGTLARFIKELIEAGKNEK